MKIKICGITCIDEICVLNKLKPDYIGFVFAESKRKINKKEAEVLCKLVDKDIKIVGVFRNNSKEFIDDILKDITLDVVQLHGNEDIEFIKWFIKKVEVWKGVSIKNKEDLDKGLKLPVNTLILDNRSPGSGESFSWKYLKNINTDKDIILAGGINENNIYEALKVENIKGVDISSGVESLINGIRRKDSYKIEKIIKIVRDK